MLNVQEYNIVSTKYNYEFRKKTKHKGCSVYYLNVPCAFDIETTSLYVKDDLTAQMTNREHALYMKDKPVTQDCYNKFSFMYIWMFGLDESVCYGRTWDEFIKLCEAIQKKFSLSEKKRLICYVHNLSYEFQFMRKYIRFTDVFATENGKPLTALCEYGIEFRDSYRLSGLSLAKTAENLRTHTIKKLEGDLDYKLIRTKDTMLTEKELLYCEHDVLILLYYIKEEIESYGNNIAKIPLTNTGRVRQHVRNACFGVNESGSKRGKVYNEYRNMISDLTMEYDEYFMLRRAMQGGFTHANFYYVGRTLNNVYSIDFTSSYPTVMLLEAFPMSKGKRIDCSLLTKEMFYDYLKKYCCVFDITFKNLRTRMSYDNYISSYKCVGENIEENNGRVYSADIIKTTITEVDFSIIKCCYEWDFFQVSDMYIYCKGPLPVEIRKSIIDLYKKKTKLKGVAGKEEEYLRSKGMLNAIYGMTVTDNIQTKAEYVNGEWSEEVITHDEILENIDKENNSKNRFLFYAWGVYTTAYARRNLWHGINSIGADYIYSDTDSIKFLNYEKHKDYIDKYNADIIKRTEMMCKSIGVDPDDLKPETIKKVKKPIGVWDFEGCYDTFKTLGAKRYLTHDKDGYHLTVAGLSKRNGIEYMINNCDSKKCVFDSFNNQLYIPAEYTGKNTHTFINDLTECYIQDYQGNTTFVSAESGIHLEEAPFTLSLSVKFIDFLLSTVRGERYKGTTEGVWNT